MSLLQDSWTASEIRVTGCRVCLSLMKPSVINCSAALWLPREGDGMAAGVGTVFLLLVGAGSPSAWVLVVLYICMANAGESKKSRVGDQSIFFLFRAYLFFFLFRSKKKMN